MKEEQKDKVSTQGMERQPMTNAQDGKQQEQELPMKEIVTQVLKDFAADIEYLKDK